MRKCSIVFKALNGAPDLKIDDDSKRDKKHFTLIDRNREKAVATHWFYPYRSIATIKFQANYDGTGKSGEVKKSITPDRIIEDLSFYTSIKNDVTKTDLKNANSSLKKNFPSVNDPMEKLKHIYYMLRNTHYTSNADFISLVNPSYSDNVKGYDYISLVSTFLAKNKIKSSNCLVLKRQVSDLDDFIFYENANYFIKAEIGKKEYFLFPPTLHKGWDDIPTEFQGAEYYALEGKSLKRGFLPVIPSSENQVINKIDFSMDKTNSTQLNVKEDVELTGASKADMQNDLLIPENFIDEESKIYFVKPVEKYVSKKDAASFPEKKANIRTEQLKSVENILKDEFGSDENIKVSGISDFSIKKNGRLPQSNSFEYYVTMKVDGLVKKLGQDYIVEMGKMLGGQLSLEKNDFEREHDVYMPYARSFKFEINFQIPDGYEVQGLEKLTMDNSNPTGSFVSKAIIENKVIKLSVQKTYSHNFEKASSWPQMVSFLEAAYTFTQQKVLLKKK